VKTTPFDKRRQKTAPTRSDSCQKGLLCISKTQAIPYKNIKETATRIKPKKVQNPKTAISGHHHNAKKPS
jgi:hypothetical protein